MAAVDHMSVIAIFGIGLSDGEAGSVDFVLPFGALAVQFSIPVIAKVNRLEREEYLFYLVQVRCCGTDSNSSCMDGNCEIGISFGCLCGD